MTAPELTLELERIRRRTRKLLGVSVGAHVLFFLLLGLFRAIGPDQTGITEITWIEPDEIVPPALPASIATGRPVPAREVAVERPSPRKTEQNFPRETPVADIAPEPQKQRAVEDKLSERLAALQRQATQQPTDIAALVTPSPVGRPTLAGVSEEVRRPHEPAELTRQERRQPNPIALRRTKTRVQKASFASTPLPETQVDRATSRKTDTEARRTLAGAQMTGPVADRPIISYNTPVYPDWAKREGVEGSVMIYFVVLPDGRVKENVMVQKTSGFADFDDNAVHAILAWRFQPLQGGATGEQWGTIMFHYRLGDSN